MGILTKMRLFGLLLAEVLGHGRLMDPPGRSSYRYFLDDPTIGPFLGSHPLNYNDNELYCGGLGHQVQMGYQCGICGDPVDKTRPRDNEWGGLYGSSGIIPRVYQEGDLINLEVHVTAHHMGWFEFKLCPMSEFDTTDPDWCFGMDESLIKFTDGSTRWEIPGQGETDRPGKTGWWYNKTGQLPKGLTCEHCVIQWRWHTANSWNCDDSGCGLGKGEQEEFYGCADISIVPMGVAPTTIKPTSPSPTTIKDTTTSKVTTTKITTQSSTMEPTPTNKPPGNESNLEEFCKNHGDGIHPHPSDCNAFIQCSSINFVNKCAPGLEFNPSISACDWPSGNC